MHIVKIAKQRSISVTFFGALIMAMILPFSMTSEHATAELPSLKMQLDSGVALSDLTCKADRILAIRDSGSPVCVRESTAERMGWQIFDATSIKDVSAEKTKLSDEKIILSSYDKEDQTEGLASSAIYPSDLWPVSSVEMPKQVRIGEAFDVVVTWHYFIPDENEPGTWIDFMHWDYDPEGYERLLRVVHPDKVDFLDSEKFPEPRLKNKRDGGHVLIYERPIGGHDYEVHQETLSFVINDKIGGIYDSFAFVVHRDGSAFWPVTDGDIVTFTTEKPELERNYDGSPKYPAPEAEGKNSYRDLSEVPTPEEYADMMIRFLDKYGKQSVDETLERTRDGSVEVDQYVDRVIEIMNEKLASTQSIDVWSYFVLPHFISAYAQTPDDTLYVTGKIITDVDSFLLEHIKVCVFDESIDGTLNELDNSCTNTENDGSWSVFFQDRTDPDIGGGDMDPVAKYYLTFYDDNGNDILTMIDTNGNPFETTERDGSFGTDNRYDTNIVIIDDVHSSNIKDGYDTFLQLYDSWFFLLNTVGYDNENYDLNNLDVTLDIDQGLLGAAYFTGTNTITLSEWHHSLNYVIPHEYGHHVMNIAYKEDLNNDGSPDATYPNTNCPDPHHLGFDSGDLECAWSEGFADFFSSAVRETAEYSNGNIENRKHQPIFGGDTLDFEPGPQTEGNVAALLWDIYDNTPAEDDMDKHISLFWTAFTQESGPGENGRADDIFGFKDDWDSLGYDSLDGLFVQNTLIAVADGDGDGVPDDQDDCPDQPGSIDNNGCPVTLTAFDEDFIDEDEDPEIGLFTAESGWGNAAPLSTVPNGENPNYVVFANNCSECSLFMTDTVDLTQLYDPQLSFWRYLHTNLDDDQDYLRLDVSADGGSTWEELDKWEPERHDADGRWHNDDPYDLSEYATSESFKIRFVATTGSGEFIMLDDVIIQSGVSVPGTVNSFYATNNEIRITDASPVFVNYLSWLPPASDGGSAITGYEIGRTHADSDANRNYAVPSASLNSYDALYAISEDGTTSYYDTELTYSINAKNGQGSGSPISRTITLPSNPDTDFDGIWDVIDIITGTISYVFALDSGEGSTTGQILSSGDQRILVRASDDGTMVQIYTYSETNQNASEVSLCNGLSAVSLDSEDILRAMCGSVTLEVESGNVDAVFDSGSDVTVAASIPEGNAMTYDDEASEIAAHETNPDEITITITNPDGTEEQHVLGGGETLPVEPEVFPEIHLNGDEIINIPMNEEWADPATVTDGHGNDITEILEVTGQVDIAQQGTYNITYNAHHSSGNSAEEKSRTVHVVDTSIKYCYKGGVAGNGYDLITLIESGSYNVIDNRGNPYANISGTNGNDLIIAGGSGDKISAKKGDDCIIGDNNRNELYGDEGADIIHGLGENDLIKGGSENDHLYGDDGRDHIEGNMHADYIRGGPGNDKLEGNDGNDDVYGDAGNDRLWGQNGNDNLHGGDGKDQLRGGDATDVLRGNAGHDNLYCGDGSNDEGRGGSGVDYAKYCESRTSIERQNPVDINFGW